MLNLHVKKIGQSLRLASLTIILTLAFQSAALSCEAGASPTPNQTDAIVQIVQKFKIIAEWLHPKCGATEVMFSFKNGDDQPEIFLGYANDLQKVLEISRDDMNRLKASATRLKSDYETLESKFGVNAYDPSAISLGERFNAEGQLLLISVPHCTLTFANSNEVIGSVRIPVASLNGFSEVSRLGFYKKGDTLKTLRSSAKIKEGLLKVAHDNLDSTNATGHVLIRSRSTCGLSDEGQPLDWKKTLSFFLQ